MDSVGEGITSVQGNDRLGLLAAAMLSFRRARSDSLPPELFGEPGWDLLLELFVADAEGRRLTGRQVGRQSNVPPTVMSRWIKHLAQTGLIIGDGCGDLDDQITLSGDAFDRIERAVAQVHAIRNTIA